MKIFIVVPIILFHFFSGIAQEEEFIAESYISTSFTAAIFPETYQIAEYEERFTPTKNEVSEAEKALSRDLITLNKDKKYQKDIVIHRRLMRFKRQYFGVINEEGQRELIINAYFYERNNDPHEEAFLNERILAKEPSAKYWQVVYNLDTKLLKDLKVGELVEQNENIDANKAEINDNRIYLEKSRSIELYENQRITPDTLNID